MPQNVLFLKNVNSVETLIQRIGALEPQENLTLILDEFKLNATDVLKDIEKIQGAMTKINCQLILAPTNDYNKEFQYRGPDSGDPSPFDEEMLRMIYQRKGMPEDEIATQIRNDKCQMIGSTYSQNEPWAEVENKIKSIKSDIIVEQADDFEIKRCDSLGMYISPTQVFVCPKMWQEKPLHPVPHTNVSLCICGEIKSLTDKVISDWVVSNEVEKPVIFNPSREQDDIYLTNRMSQLASANQSYYPISGENCSSMYYGEMQTDVPIIRSDCRQNGILNPAHAYIQLFESDEEKVSLAFEHKSQVFIDAMNAAINACTTEAKKNELMTLRDDYCKSNDPNEALNKFVVTAATRQKTILGDEKSYGTKSYTAFYKRLPAQFQTNFKLLPETTFGVFKKKFTEMVLNFNSSTKSDDNAAQDARSQTRKK